MTLEELKKKWGTQAISLCLETIAKQKLPGFQTGELLLEIAADLRALLEEK